MTASRSTARIVWGVDALARLREAPDRAAILLDIDGTLAPIVERPEDAAVPDETREVLRGLVERYALVGAITGRPGPLGRADGVRRRRARRRQPRARARRRRRDDGAAACASFRDGVAWPVEDKGLALSYHYRTHPDHEAARAELELVAERARTRGLPRTVREDGARGAAAARRRQGHGRPHAARARRAAAGASSPATTRPTSTPSARWTSWRSA